MNIDSLLEAHNLLKERAEELCRVTALGDERFLEALADSSRVDRVIRAIEAELREVFFPAIEDRIFNLFSDGVLATFENEEGRYIINREKNEGWRSGGSAPWLIYPNGRRERGGVLSDLAVKLARLGLRPARTAETIRTEIAELEKAS